MKRIAVVTLGYRVYGRAILSWLNAIRVARSTHPATLIDQLTLWGNPAGIAAGHDMVVAKYQHAQRLIAEADCYDAVVFVEDDMIIPDDGIAKMIDHLNAGKAVIYGLYVWRHGTPKWSIYTRIDYNQGRSISHREPDALAAWGKVIPCVGVGFGFTAMTARVFTEIAVRRGGPACNDWYFSIDAQEAGIEQWGDLSIVCGHIAPDPSPRILWPDPDYPDLARVEPI